VMCIYDGDFTTSLPRPHGADATARRVLVVITDDSVELWATSKRRGAILITDRK